MQKAVFTFHKSWWTMMILRKTSSCSLVFLNMHKLIHDMIISWNFICDMIERVCQQQLPGSSVVLKYWDAFIYLELLPNEWTILEDILKLLRAFKIETAHLSGEKFPINSAFRPLLHEIYVRLLSKKMMSVQLTYLKIHYKNIWNSRYVDPNIKFLMHK